MTTNKQRVILAVAVMAAILVSAQKCDKKKVKKEIRKWNIKAAKALVACDEAWDEIYKEEANSIGEKIIEEHGDDPSWTDEMAEEEFKKRTAELNLHNDRFEEAMVIISNSMEAIEKSLDAADDIDSKAIAAAIKDIVGAFNDVLEILNLFKSENEKLASALEWIGTITGGAESLLGMLEGE
jgi:hypothetical protein